jgi:putative tricarboxylic transport membrane protein
MALLARIGIFASIQVGIGWGEKRPRAGFCPFYVSLVVLFYCIINVMAVLAVPDNGKTFAEWSGLRHVFSGLVPTVVDVGLLP